MAKIVQGVVRGPNPYFAIDSTLYAPGEIAPVPADQVGEGKKFAAPDGGSIVGEVLDTAQVATAQPDRLNVDDFLKQGADQIVAAIASGSVDSHLGVIEQQELARRGPARKGVTEAIAARLSATRR